MDFFVLDRERQGLGQVVTCSGAYKDGSLRIFGYAFEINEQASESIEGIKGLWPLREATSAIYDKFLVISFISETRIFDMCNGVLDETQIEGFNSQEKTLFCHYAVYNQWVQVTSTSVRLVSSTSGKLKIIWSPPVGCSVNAASANATQVLLGTTGGSLVYLEIGDGVFTNLKYANVGCDISCLDVNPIGEKPNYSSIAAVGTWTDICVKMYSLPDLSLLSTEQLGGEIIPRSVLLCSFEGISYLLCALGDGHLLNFVLSINTGQLTDRKVVALATRPIQLRTFPSKEATNVFAASDRSAVIYSSNKKLFYGNVSLEEEVSCICPFNTAASPNSFVIVKGDTFTIGTIDETQKLRIRSLHGEHARRICDQEQTRTFAICNGNYNIDGDIPAMSVCLFCDIKCCRISDIRLLPFEYGCSILSCSFSDDDKVYYCVGTAFVMSGSTEPTKGRILVLEVVKEKLKEVTRIDTDGAVYCLKAFNGKLLAAINQKIRLYKWDAKQLQPECEHNGHVLAHIQTFGDFIVVGDSLKSISVLLFKQKKVGGAIEELARDHDAKRMSAVEILDDNIYLGAQDNFNLFMVKNNSKSATAERSRLEVVGEYHLGELVNRFRHGSLAMQSRDSNVGQMPTVIFGTENGVVGVLASLPREQYLVLEKLQTALQKVIKGVGGLSHEQWRSFYNKNENVDAKSFLDGDLIESFLDLSKSQMEEISEQIAVPIEELKDTVEELSCIC